MSEQESASQDGCGAGCPRCSGLHVPAGLAGWSLAWLAACVFVLPLVLVIAGAAIVPMIWAHQAGPFVGGLAGLAVGALTAVVAARLTGKGPGRRERRGNGQSHG